MTEERLNGGCLDEREAFEAWVLTQPGGTEYTIRRRDMAGSERLGSYVEQAVDFAWKALCALSTSKQAGSEPVNRLLINALDRYLRQDETAKDTDNGVYRQGQQAMSAALSTPPAVMPAAPSDAAMSPAREEALQTLAAYVSNPPSGALPPEVADAVRIALSNPAPANGDPANPRDDSDRAYTKPIGYLPAHELGRLHSGHDANLRSAKFGPSPLDGDVPVYFDLPIAAPAPATSEDERASFETIMGVGRDLARAPNGDYVSAYVQNDWEVWQARAALAQPAPSAAIAAREQEVTEDFSRWARHWFGSEADPKSIAKAIACMPTPPNADHEHAK